VVEPLYEAQVRLLLQCLPALREHPDFALKGGTAINLFLQPLPRVSVDIDLAYLRIGPRDEAVAEIAGRLGSLGEELVERLPRVVVQPQRTEGQLVRLVVSNPEARVKIEPNTIFRGFVFPSQEAELCTEAQQQFQSYVQARILHVADLYAGKLCAALDRQHPRDLFDVQLLLDRTGITPDIRRAFVVYLAGHNRPMHELLQPRMQTFPCSTELISSA
jgi:predicted nucleotidyltransferase component of viral defense system